jgi:hypothetical protein
MPSPTHNAIMEQLKTGPKTDKQLKATRGTYAYQTLQALKHANVITKVNDKYCLGPEEQYTGAKPDKGYLPITPDPTINYIQTEHFELPIDREAFLKDAPLFAIGYAYLIKLLSPTHNMGQPHPAAQPNKEVAHRNILTILAPYLTTETISS